MTNNSCTSGNPEDGDHYPSDCEILEGYRQRSREKMARPSTSEEKLVLAKAEPVLLLLLDVDGVLTDGSLVYSENGVESKTFNTQDGLGIWLVQKGGVDVGIITARTSPMVQKRGEELGMKYICQGAKNKLGAFKDILDQSAVKPYQVCYMGDDLIDLSLLTRVGLAACPANAVAEVKEISHFVADRTGGNGAVRQTCELILRAKGRYEELVQQFLC
jgi:3-deoxy-D-manno-octulosonate 8-phosphate phosphatase (KDO 8-P phosphatase)